MAYLDVTSINFVQEILENIETVTSEFKNVEKISGDWAKAQSITPFKEKFYDGKINTYMLKLDENLIDFNEKKLLSISKEEKLLKIQHFRNCSNFHNKLLTDNPCIRQLCYNVMHPNSKINPHYGVNGISANREPDHFRIQITIDPGNSAYFYIDGLPPLEYTSGLVFGFNDGLVNHWAENKGNKSRTVLIIDVDKTVIPENLPKLFSK
jgi:hypothetical protein